MFTNMFSIELQAQRNLQFKLIGLEFGTTTVSIICLKRVLFELTVVKLALNMKFKFMNVPSGTVITTSLI